MRRTKDTPTERYPKDVAGMPCYAAKTGMQIMVLPDALGGSIPADDENCAVANGCRNQLNTPYVSVGRRRTELALPHPDGVLKPGHGKTKWAVVRFENSESVRKIVIAADTGELDVEHGVVVELLPPRPSDGPNRTPRSGATNGKGRRLAGFGQDKLTLDGVRNLAGQRRRA